LVRLTAGMTTAHDVAAAQTAFGLALLRRLAAAAPDEGLLLSPTSAAQALGMLAPALTGGRAVALAGLLGLPPWSAQQSDALAEQTRVLDGLRTDPDGGADSLQTSNRVWTDRRYRLGADHVAAVRAAFAASLDQADFGQDPVGATDRVNAAVAEDTRGLVPALFPRPLDRATVLVLTNAVHLRARWASPFTWTGPEPFATARGPVDVAMMAGASGRGRSAAGWESVELSYRDGTLTAVAVLPPEGTDPVTVDEAVLGALDRAAPRPVDVRLPRLRMAVRTDLRDPRVDLGLPLRLPELGPDVRVDQVVQEAVLDVDQDGTVAAAATGAAMVAVSLRMPLPVVSFDRPFLLLLTDSATRSPLFLAVVRDPSR
jgi:serpin B